MCLVFEQLPKPTKGITASPNHQLDARPTLLRKLTSNDRQTPVLPSLDTIMSMQNTYVRQSDR